MGEAFAANVVTTFGSGGLLVGHSINGLGEYGVRTVAVDEMNGHAIAAPFGEFMNAKSPAMVDVEVSEEPLFQDVVVAAGRVLTVL